MGVSNIATASVLATVQSKKERFPIWAQNPELSAVKMESKRLVVLKKKWQALLLTNLVERRYQITPLSEYLHWVDVFLCPDLLLLLPPPSVRFFVSIVIPVVLPFLGSGDREKKCLNVLVANLQMCIFTIETCHETMDQNVFFLTLLVCIVLNILDILGNVHLFVLGELSKNSLFRELWVHKQCF